MKNLARLIIACFAAQLLFVGIVSAKVNTSSSTVVRAMPVEPPEDGGPFEGF